MVIKSGLTRWWRGLERNITCLRYTAGRISSPSRRTWGRARSTATASSGRPGAGFWILNVTETLTLKKQHLNVPTEATQFIIWRAIFAETQNYNFEHCFKMQNGCNNSLILSTVCTVWCSLIMQCLCSYFDVTKIKTNSLACVFCLRIIIIFPDIKTWQGHWALLVKLEQNKFCKSFMKPLLHKMSDPIEWINH